jgi:hypothetical protein
VYDLFWGVAPYSLVGMYKLFEEQHSAPFFKVDCEQKVPPKRWKPYTGLHGVVFWKTGMFIFNAIESLSLN